MQTRKLRRARVSVATWLGPLGALLLALGFTVSGSNMVVAAGPEKPKKPEKPETTETKTANPFFPFCIENHDAQKRTIPQQATLVKELGFDGIGHLWLENVPERLETLDDAGLELCWIHTLVNLAPDKPPYDPKLTEVLPMLEGRGVLLSLAVVGQPASDQSFDPRAVEILREIADKAAKHDVRVVLYHHLNHWTERFEDCVRVARKVDRPNLGAMFNLCHWARMEPEEGLRELLTSAEPHLFCVAINGTDRPAEVQSGDGQFIHPLDTGTYDLSGLLRILQDLDYKGPIGLMCWGLKGDARDHLERSMTAWRKMQQQLAKP